MLISPWVDLLHSFPSINQESRHDYIPNWGFHHRPSLDWPPPTIEYLKRLHASWPSGSQRAVPSIDPLTSKPGNGAAEVRVGDEGKGGPEKTCQTNETTKVEIDGEMIE